GGTARQSYVIEVVEEEENHPPVFTTTPVVDAYVNVPYVYQAGAFDEDGDRLTFGRPIGPDGLRINDTTALVEWTPSGAQLGLNDVTLQVSDGRGGFATQVYKITVHIEPGTHPPKIITTPPDRFNLPGASHAPQGNVNPQQIQLQLGAGQVH